MLPGRLRSYLERHRNYLALHRKSRFVRQLSSYCVQLHALYENSNYDPQTNGEHFVLRTLAGQHFNSIFDIGANVGDWALMAHEVFPKAQIHCFEIVPQTYEALKSNTAHIPEITVNNFGLSDKDGEVSVTFYPHADTLASLVDGAHQNAHHTVQGRVRRGDEYVRERNIAQIDFLKIDVEGAEGLVLNGLAETIGVGRATVVQFEYGKVNILAKFLLRDFYDFFVSKGYKVGKIYPNYVDFREYKLEHEDFIGPNYLAVLANRADIINLLA